jgi:site-specific recombinase
MFEFPQNPSRSDLRWFGVLLGGFLPLAGWLIGRRLELEPPWLVLFALSAVSLATAAFAPRWLRGVHWLWHAATFPIGWLISRILLAVVYWGVLTPIALTLRMRGRDLLGRRFDRETKSYWTRHDPPADIARYFRPF